MNVSVGLNQSCVKSTPACRRLYFLQLYSPRCMTQLEISVLPNLLEIMELRGEQSGPNVTQFPLKK